MVEQRKGSDGGHFRFVEVVAKSQVENFFLPPEIYRERLLYRERLCTVANSVSHYSFPPHSLERQSKELKH